MSALTSPDPLNKVSLPGIDALRSITPPMAYPTNSSKRKADDADLDHHHHRRPFPRSNDHSEPRQVPCKHCGQIVSFRHRETDEFTMEYWDDHHTYCSKNREQITFSMVQGNDRNATGVKRRRAKRTQEERIAYLRDDPYVAEFEAYRVLCASCNKWIRLRPNSTYCSIPWDAHRKSCLARKLPKSSSSVEERNDTLGRDPDVLKFDSQRVLCRICSRWIEIAQDDNIQAIQTWLQHRSACRSALSKNSTYHSPQNMSHSLSDIRDAADGPNFFSRPGSSSMSHSGSSSSASPRNAIILPPLDPKYIAPTRRSPPVHHSPSPSASSNGSAHPSGTWDPRQEQRHRNASQRADNLRADPLLEAVEPNRVLCKMCQKWVNLRQDSPYCAHPWIQHREKCLIRNERRAKPMNGSSVVMPHHPGLSHGGDENCHPGTSQPEDEYTTDRDRPSRGYGSPVYHPQQQQQQQQPLEASYPAVSSIRVKPSEPSSPSSSRQPRSRGARRSSQSLDLASLHGRTNFVLASIQHLFQSSYGPTDALSISALLTYLNAAMPPDKFEDFDTPEVAKIASSLQLKDRIVLEGDKLRPLADTI